MFLFQYKVTLTLSYPSQVVLLTLPSQLVWRYAATVKESAKCSWHFFPDGQRQRNPDHVKPLALAFSLLLLWQLVGAFLYMVRDVACFRDKSTAYQCKTNAAFPFSEDVTTVWLASLCIFTVLSIVGKSYIMGFSSGLSTRWLFLFTDTNFQ